MILDWKKISTIALVAIWLGVVHGTRVSADNLRGSSGSGQAEELRWKLKAGQKFKVEYDQQMKQTMDMGGGEQEMPMHYTMYMSWTVDEAKDEAVTMTQTVDRVKMKMTLPAGMGDVEFDSDSKEEPEGFAGQIANGMRALVGMKITQTMDGRGKSIKSEIDPAVLEELKNSPMGSQFASEDMLKNMIGHASCVLPEKSVDAGATWDDTFEVKNQMGTMKTNAKYTYEGNETVDGKSLSKISVVSSVAIEPGEESPVEIELADQDNNGVIYFDNNEGRLTSATMNQAMTMNVTAMGQEIKVVTSGTVTFSIKPDDGSGDKKPEANRDGDRPADAKSDKQ